MKEEMEPFEGRLEFLKLLSKLSASQHSVHKVAGFALTHSYLYEDLYNCIIEELEQATINVRLNLLYVIDAICHFSPKYRFKGYIDLIRKDLAMLVGCVVPDDGKGNVNLASTSKVLLGWRQRKFFPAAEVDPIANGLQARLGSTPTTPSPSGEFSRQEIFRRIEEDRERHKRFREEHWVRTEDLPDEFNEEWETGSDLNERDLADIAADNKIFFAMKRRRVGSLVPEERISNNATKSTPKSAAQLQTYTAPTSQLLSTTQNNTSDPLDIVPSVGTESTQKSPSSIVKTDETSTESNNTLQTVESPAEQKKPAPLPDPINIPPSVGSESTQEPLSSTVRTEESSTESHITSQTAESPVEQPKLASLPDPMDIDPPIGIESTQESSSSIVTDETSTQSNITSHTVAEQKESAPLSPAQNDASDQMDILPSVGTESTQESSSIVKTEESSTESNTTSQTVESPAEQLKSVSLPDPINIDPSIGIESTQELSSSIVKMDESLPGSNITSQTAESPSQQQKSVPLPDPNDILPFTEIDSKKSLSSIVKTSEPSPESDVTSITTESLVEQQTSVPLPEPSQIESPKPPSETSELQTDLIASDTPNVLT